MKILISSVALLILLPKIAVQFLLGWYQQKKIAIYVRDYAGKDLRPFQHRTVLIANKPLVDFDKWFLCLKGQLDLIGPKAIELNSASNLNIDHSIRFKVAPGIITPFQVKQSSGIAHQSEKMISSDFAENASVARRCQLLTIWLVQQFLPAKNPSLPSPKNFNLLGIEIINTTMKSAVSTIINGLDSKQSKTKKYAFVNADCVNQYYKNAGYAQILSNFDAVFADGIGVKIAARLQGIALADNVNGTDMFPLLCEQLEQQQKRIYLLGASAHVIRKVAHKLSIEYPHITIAGYSDGFTHNDQPEALHTLINDSDADLLLVAMGAPRQEQWIENNIKNIKVKAVMGVGGLFDFYSEEVSRAPMWLRELSLEWVWRLAVQPLDKGKRYLVGNPLFLFRAIRHSLGTAKVSKAINPLTTGVRHDSV